MTRTVEGTRNVATAAATRRAAGLLLVTSVLAVGCAVGNAADSDAVVYDAATVARGEYLVTIIGCNDCHTPFADGPNGPAPDMTRMLSGHPEDLVMAAAPALGEGHWGWAGAATNTAFAGPWGISYTANLTPDQNTGLGIWTEEMFVRALREGRHMGTSRQILPPMPWPFYGRMTDDDLRAVFAYLRSIPPITNHVPDPLIVEPYDEGPREQPVVKAPLHSNGAASRLSGVARRSHMADVLPPRALPAVRIAVLGATRGFTTGC